MPSNEPRNTSQHSARRPAAGTRSSKDHPNRPHPHVTLIEGLRRSAQAWQQMVADQDMRLQTFNEYTAVGERFIAYAAAHGVTELDQVTPDLAQSFIYAPGRSRQGALIPVPADNTARQRSSGLAALYLQCRKAQLTSADPLLDAPSIPRTPRLEGTPLFDQDITQLRLFAERGHPDTRDASLLALALAGFTSAEVGHATTAHLGRAVSRIWTDGTTYTAARYCPLDPWGLRVLADRADHLARTARRPGPHYLVTDATSDYRRQCSIGSGFIAIARRAGLRTTSRSIVYRDITRYTARRVFEETGQLSEVAARLGTGSIEVAAAYAGYSFTTGEEA